MGASTLNGPTLSFSRTATTRMACPDGMEQEAAFLQSLDKVTKWQVHGDALKLLDGSGKTVARFVAVDLK